MRIAGLYKDIPLTLAASMSETLNTDGRQWFVLNYLSKPGRPTPQKYIDKFNKEGHSIELFAPTIRPARIIKGEVKYLERLLTFFYVFVRGSFEEIKELCSRPDNNLSFLLDHSSANRYGIISDADMENFRIIARAHSNTIPFFDIRNIQLSEGDLVEVVDGECAGMKGRYIPKSRSNKGNLVIAVTSGLGAVVWDIDVKYIRILEFAPDTRRQYDLLDSFIPKLLPILRKFHAREELSEKEKTQLNLFNQRMGVVSPNNPKTEAKLLAVLISVQTIIGDFPALCASKQRYEKLKPALTNPWTIALTELLLSISTRQPSRLQAAAQTLRQATAGTTTPATTPIATHHITTPASLTASQTRLLEEYRYYESHLHP